MNTSIGKLFAVAAIGTALAAFAAEPLLKIDFEDEVPGRPTSKMKKIWGSQGDDTMAISSEKSVTGDKCLVVERTANEGQWGFGVPLPRLKSGVVTLEYSFQIEGAGNAAFLGFELRPFNNKEEFLLGWGVQDFRMNTRSFVKGAPRTGAKRKLPDVESGVWYTVKVTCPLSKADGENARFEMIKAASKEVVLEREIPFNHQTELGSFVINFHPKKNNFRLYIDDISLTAAEGK